MSQITGSTTNRSAVHHNRTKSEIIERASTLEGKSVSKDQKSQLFPSSLILEPQMEKYLKELQGGFRSKQQRVVQIEGVHVFFSVDGSQMGKEEKKTEREQTIGT